MLAPLSCAALSLASTASALRFRKSDRCTSPTVCSLSRSSAVEFCDVKRGLGVDDRDGDALVGLDLSIPDIVLCPSKCCCISYEHSEIRIDIV